MQKIIRLLIIGLGTSRSLAVLLPVLVMVVMLVSGGMSLIIYKEIIPDLVSFTIIVTLLTAPYGLYVFFSLIIKLNASEARLQSLSIMDDLTGIHNRRYFIAQAEHELAKAKRYGNIFSIILIDIDNFKGINDRYGHFGGDAVIRTLAVVCNETLRATDVFARYGGEEFVFIIPESNKSDVRFFAERVRERLEQATVHYCGADIHFTVSLGVRAFDASIDSLEVMLRNADTALYEAKRAGKNRVVVFEHEF